jgi:hypothetical protein
VSAGRPVLVEDQDNQPPDGHFRQVSKVNLAAITIRKACFEDTGGLSSEEIIYWMTDHQEAEFRLPWINISRTIWTSSATDRLSESVLRDLKICTHRTP